MSPDPLMILVVGVGFKKGQTVLSNSSGVAIIRTILEEWDAYVQFADPLVDAEQIDFCLRIDIEEDWNEANLHTFDGIIVAVDQEGLDLSLLDRLQRVKVQDLSGRRRRKFSGNWPVPTVSTADFGEKTTSRIAVYIDTE